ncbi:hypothetical protein Tco_0497516 [Tanacetum coccineum]
MQKEKEQKDRLNAVKARLIYGEESGVKIRNHEESHYSESKTPNCPKEPPRRHGGRYSEARFNHNHQCIKRLMKKQIPSPQPTQAAEKKGACWKDWEEEWSQLHQHVLIVIGESLKHKRTDVETRRRQQRQNNLLVHTSQFSRKVEDK